MSISDSFKDKRTNERSEERSETPLKRKPAIRTWHVGDRIRNRYEIHRILGGPGKSGMGIIYVCYDHEFKEAVALKTLQDSFLADRAAVERFKWEAEAWVWLEKHHNIVRAKYVQVIDGRPYVFLEYVVGDKQYGADLSGWIWGRGLQRGSEPHIPMILSFAIQFCHGMIHANNRFKELGKPFVHRDVKPQNIMVTSDKVLKVTDFGLVKTFAGPSGRILSTKVGDEPQDQLRLWQSGNICGTPPYMSPEQCLGNEDLDARSDIYAFGCVLYEMLIGRHVFDVEKAEEFIRHHIKTKPRFPISNKELDVVVMKCLEKERNKRYQSFEEMEEALSWLYRDLTGEVIQLPEAAALDGWELSNKGRSLANIGLLEEAITCYHEALKTDPRCVEAHNNLGHAYYEQGKLDEASKEYREALRMNPNFASAHNNLGRVYCDQEKLDEAIGEYREALRIDPYSAEVPNNLGVAYHKQGKLDEAIGEYREALRTNPYLASAHNNLGLVFYEQGKLDQAVREYRETLRIDPSFASAHNNLGLVFYEQGKLDQAVREYRETLRIDPSFASAHNNLGRVYRDQGKLDEAVREYWEALQTNPNFAEAHYNLGRVYLHHGKLDEAIREYREAVRIDPNFAQAHYNLSLVLEKTNKQDALNQWKTYVNIAQDIPSQRNWVRRAQGRIVDLEEELR